MPVAKKWEKMSKSKYNGVDPDQVVEHFGIDSTRLISMADVVPTSPRKWNQESKNTHYWILLYIKLLTLRKIISFADLMGFLRFQDKLWLTVQDFVSVKEAIDMKVRDRDDEWQKIENEILDARNYYLKGITHSYADYHQISVVISKLQGLMGFLRVSLTHYWHYRGDRKSVV